MGVNGFIEKVRSLGYDVEYRQNGRVLMDEEVVITEDNYYNVAIPPHFIFDAPFEVVMEYVRNEIKVLKIE